MPSDWLGLMPRSNPGVIRNTVLQCVEGTGSSGETSVAGTWEKSINGGKGCEHLRCGEYCKRLLWLNAGAAHPLTQIRYRNPNSRMTLGGRTWERRGMS